MIISLKQGIKLNHNTHISLLNLFQEFNETWNQKCHGDKYKVDPSNKCSVIQYLSEVRHTIRMQYYQTYSFLIGYKPCDSLLTIQSRKNV